MHPDVIVIGGSFAGLAAALQVGRARRRVLLIDAGKPRNRFAAASHGFLGQDGRTPAEILETARHQLAAYPTVVRMADEVVEVSARDGRFQTRLAGGDTFTTDRIVLATGVKDTLPDVPGLQKEWGRSVFHCPYCHGYEIGGGAIGVLASSALAVHQATLVSDWGRTTLFTNGAFEPQPEDVDGLERRGIAIETASVGAWAAGGAGRTGMALADGRFIALDGLFVASRTSMASPVAAQLGCAFDDGMQGPVIRIDAMQQTTVPGVYAAGDAARTMHSVTFAVSTGAFAGIAAHQSMVFGKAA